VTQGYLVLPKEIRLESSIVQNLKRRPSWKVALQAVFNLTLYVALWWLAANISRWWFWLIAWWFQAVILCGFLGAAHDCAHGTFAAKGRGNHVAGALWSAGILLNFALYKYHHLEHHSHTSIEGDTEPAGTFPDLKSYLASLPMTGFFVAFWRMSLQACIGEFPHFVRTAAARRAVRQDNIYLSAWLCTICGATIMWPHTLLFFYWVPLFLLLPMLLWTSLPEHYDCEQSSNVLSNTRTVVSNALFRFVSWNANFHAEHHVYPSIPSSNLPRVHSLIGRHFEFRESSYILFHVRLILSLIRKNRTKSSLETLKPEERVVFSTYHEDSLLAEHPIGDGGTE
jgi:fatty acid desaturase